MRRKSTRIQRRRGKKPFSRSFSLPPSCVWSKECFDGRRAPQLFLRQSHDLAQYADYPLFFVVRSKQAHFFWGRACLIDFHHYLISDIVRPITLHSTRIVLVDLHWFFSPEDNSHLRALPVVWIGHDSLTFSRILKRRYWNATSGHSMSFCLSKEPMNSRELLCPLFVSMSRSINLQH